MRSRPPMIFVTATLLLLGATSSAHAMLHPGLGRFLQRDPIGAADGMSLYEYTRTNPYLHRDPLGTATWTRTGGQEVPGAGGEVMLENGDTGTVKVFTDATWEQGRLRRAGGISLEFRTTDEKKASCHKCNWLQFVRAYRKDKSGHEEDGTYMASGTYKYYGQWYVDTFWTRPESVYYNTEGMHNQTGTEISIFDGPSALYDRRRHSEVGQEFEAFLTCDKRVYWNVHWECVCTPGAQGVWGCGYTNIRGYASVGLDRRFLGSDELLLGYSHRSDDQKTLTKPVYHTNPFF